MEHLLEWLLKSDQLRVARVQGDDVEEVLVDDVDAYGQDVVEHVAHHLLVFEDDHVVIGRLVDAHHQVRGLVVTRV